jgi:3-methyl-2-oxobutanoate hydroxymethyltransferase
MSATARTSRITARDLTARKGGEPIVSLTAYSAPVARLLDKVCDFILVGDSVGMVLYGLPTTLGVTLEMMIAHGQAVTRATERACVVVDMPFGSYQESPEQAFRHAARIMAETNCSGVKIEGGEEMAPTVAFLSARGIPVLGHIGLTPQAVNTLGGFLVQGRDEARAAQVLADAQAVAHAGAFGIVVEAIVEPLARRLTDAIAIPTIGIGASAACDGQILVTDDVIGLFADFTPKFAKRYGQVGDAIAEAVAGYARDVRARAFPGLEHTFAVRPAK